MRTRGRLRSRDNSQGIQQGAYSTAYPVTSIPHLEKQREMYDTSSTAHLMIEAIRVYSYSIMTLYSAWYRFLVSLEHLMYESPVTPGEIIAMSHTAMSYI